MSAFHFQLPDSSPQVQGGLVAFLHTFPVIVFSQPGCRGRMS